ncbi:MAG: biotin transporter BioY [Prochlorotrichaceae cyanobacterium]|jgi:biotin transport system substrate-specific component
MTPTELIWAFIGLLLTIGGTWIEASIAIPAWVWNPDGIQIYALGTSFQLAAVFLVSCAGGRNPGVLSQIAYIILGLTWLPIFTGGGGLDYIHEASFGYLLGFIPAAWVCGTIAFEEPLRLESLALSCLAGLGTIHGFGLLYLLIGTHLSWLISDTIPLWRSLLSYSLYPLPSQLAIVCATSVVAYGVRQILFY